MNLIASFFYGLIVYSFVGIFLVFIFAGIFFGLIVFYTYLILEIIFNSISDLFRKRT